MVLLNTYLILCNAKCNANGFKYKKSPLNKGKKRSARRGSNPRPPPWQGGAPPLSHSRIAYCVMSCVSHARYIIQYELTFVNKKNKKIKKNLQPLFLLINHTKKQIQNIHRN
jgi:hypothetical protein